MIAFLLLGVGQQGTTIQDPFLDHFIGHWQVTRKQGKKVMRGTADCEWTLQHHYMRLHYGGPKKSKPYEADVSITFEKKSNRYEVFWLDIYGGNLPGSIGYGTRQDASLVMLWKDTDGTLRNTFTYDAKKKRWTSVIDQTGKDGKWSNFCTETWVRR